MDTKPSSGVPKGIVGRAKVLADIQGIMDGVEASKGAFILLAGEAGVGKTTLAQAISYIARGRGWTVISGECRFVDYGDPYRPILQAMDGLVESMERAGSANGQTGPEPSPSCSVPSAMYMPMGMSGLTSDKETEAVEETPKIKMEYASERMRMFESVAKTLEDAEKKAPIFMMLDDLDGASDAVLQVLHYLARSTKGMRVMMLGTYRPDVPGSNRSKRPFLELASKMDREGLVKTIHVERLGKEDTAEMLTHLIGTRLPSSIVKRIHEVSQGNPFFIEEFVKGIRGREPPKDLEQLTIPSTISEMVVHRLDGLGKEPRLVLEYGAVIGNEFPYSLLKATTNLDEDSLVEALDGLAETRILEEREKGTELHFRFSENMVREVLYSSLTLTRRRLLHRKVASAIEEEAMDGKAASTARRRDNVGDVYSLAYHFIMGGDPEKAFEYSLKAGETAMKSYAFDEAVFYFKKALGMLERMGPVPDEKKIRLYLDLSQILPVQGHWKEALKFLEEAIELSKEDTKEKAAAYRQIGFILVHRNDWTGASKAFQRAAEISESIGDEEGLGQSYRGLTRISWRRGDHETALEYGKKAMFCAERSDDRLLMAGIMMEIAGSYCELKADYPMSMEFLNCAIEHIDPEKDLLILAKVYNNMGDINMRMNDYEKAMDSFEKALKIADRVGSLEIRSIGYSNMAECLVRAGRPTEARPFLEKALDANNRLGNQAYNAICIYVDGMLAGALGDIPRAEERFGTAINMMREVNRPFDIGLAFLEYGKVLKKVGRKRKAIETLESALEIFTQIDSKRFIKAAKSELDGLRSE